MEIILFVVSNLQKEKKNLSSNKLEAHGSQNDHNFQIKKILKCSLAKENKLKQQECYC